MYVVQSVDRGGRIVERLEDRSLSVIVAKVVEWAPEMVRRGGCIQVWSKNESGVPSVSAKQEPHALNQDEAGGA